MEKTEYENNKKEIEFRIFDTLRKIIKAVDIYSIKLKEKYGINASQLSCLLAVGNSGPISLSKLSQKVSLSPSMITSIIDQLESKELVRRTQNSPDRRVKLIELTEKGKETIQNAPISFQKKLIDSLRFLKNEEKLEIDRGLSKLLSLILSEILIESPILVAEEKLVGVEPAVINTEGNMKNEKSMTKK